MVPTSQSGVAIAPIPSRPLLSGLCRTCRTPRLRKCGGLVPQNHFWEGTMKLPRRKFLRLAAGAAALPFAPHIAQAQAYPTRPVRIIVGYPAGGGTDIVARLNHNGSSPGSAGEAAQV